jgi:hypothetical protein
MEAYVSWCVHEVLGRVEKFQELWQLLYRGCEQARPIRGMAINGQGLGMQTYPYPDS